MGTSPATVFARPVAARPAYQVGPLLMGPDPEDLRKCESEYCQVGGIAQGGMCLSGQLRHDRHVRVKRNDIFIVGLC